MDHLINEMRKRGGREMRVFSYRTSGAWIAIQRPEEEVGADSALDEIRRVLSDTLRCSNLVVLTGLGTSLHVNVDHAATEVNKKRTAQPGKFIAPTMWDLWEAARAESGADFPRVLALSKLPKSEQEKGNIEALLSHCKAASEFVDDESQRDIITLFIEKTERIVRDRVRFLGAADEVSVHADLLRRLARRSSRKVRSKIFTTNYDLCFEHAARQGRYIVVDGFSHTTPQVFDSIYFGYDIVKRESNPDSHDFISNVFQLYKLHGSIDWTKNSTTNEIEKDPATESPVLVYPRNTKYELAFEQPYLEMMSALQAAIRQPDTGLLIMGFGFNDSHISEPILSAIRSNLSLKVVICDPALSNKTADENNGRAQAGSDTQNPYLKKTRYLIEHGDARLALISGTFEEVVPMLPDIAAQTDLEQHLERVRMLRGEGNV